MEKMDEYDKFVLELTNEAGDVLDGHHPLVVAPALMTLLIDLTDYMKTEEVYQEQLDAMSQDLLKISTDMKTRKH